MKRLRYFLLAACVLATVGLFVGMPATKSDSAQLHVSFDFKRGSMASGQYAVWVEDLDGDLVKTLFVTSFTASGGYERRKESLPGWVTRAIPTMRGADGLDAASGPTPPNGRRTYTWDCTDRQGRPVPPGEYRFCLEGSYYWADRVFFSGVVRVGGPAQNDIPVSVALYGEESGPQTMIENLRASFAAIE